MSAVLAGISVTLVVFWVALVLDLQRWWPGSLRIDRTTTPGSDNPDDLLIVIPARNEEESLKATLPELLRQRGEFARLIVVDDHSTDDTAGVVERVCGGDEAVELVRASELAAGWTGKLHALVEGLRAATHGAGVARVSDRYDWVLFTDADIAHHPTSLASLRARARESGRDLVSVMARLRNETFWEKILIPPFVYFFQLLYPFRRVSDDDSRVAAAAGGCVLLRTRLLEEIGGLEALKGCVIDDVALAKRCKAAGGRLLLGIDPGVRSLRGYESFADLAEMVARTAFTQLRKSWTLLAATLAGLALFFVSPPLLLVLGLLLASPATAACAAVAWLAQAATLFPVVRHQRAPLWASAFLPLAAALYGYMTVLSATRHLRGGPRWRGRTV